MSMQDDVIDFRSKYNLSIPGKPTNLDYDIFKFRVGHLEEELNELKEAFSNPGSNKNELMMEITDALVDLCYVAIGTSIGMGINFQACWDEVHKANMSKINANEDLILKEDIKMILSSHLDGLRRTLLKLCMFHLKKSRPSCFQHIRLSTRGPKKDIVSMVLWMTTCMTRPP